MIQRSASVGPRCTASVGTWPPSKVGSAVGRVEAGFAAAAAAAELAVVLQMMNDPRQGGRERPMGAIHCHHHLDPTNKR